MQTPCQVWDGKHRKSDGRPMLGKRYAYRVLWAERYGPLTPQEILHHLCENKWCVNIDHLEVKGQGAHIREHGLTGDHSQAIKTHCPAGHLYSSENTYVYQRKASRGKNASVERHCKICHRATKLRYSARKGL